MESEIYDASLSDEAREYLKELWSEWWKLRPDHEPSRPVREIKWKLSSTRPVNHPQRRIGAVTAVVQRWKYLSVIWERPGDDIVKKWETRCDELSHRYWESHYTLKSKASSKPMQLIGKDRRRDILGNVIFPWALIRQEHLWSAYLEMGGSDTNEKLRRAKLRLFGDQEKTAQEFSRKYYQQQALLQIYEDFCLNDSSECRDCPFPEQLAQWEM